MLQAGLDLWDETMRHRGLVFQQGPAFGFMLCLYLLESFNNSEAREMAPWVKRLLHKHENWSSICNTHIKTPDVGWRGDSVVEICTRASDRHSFCSQARPHCTVSRNYKTKVQG